MTILIDNDLEYYFNTEACSPRCCNCYAYEQCACMREDGC